MRKPLWTRDEEIKFLGDIASKKPMGQIAKELDRTESALNLRLQKIIFDNVSQGKTYGNMAKMLHIPEDKVKQYYYTFKTNIDNKTGGGLNNSSEYHSNKSSEPESKLKSLVTSAPIAEKSLQDTTVSTKLKKIEQQNKFMREIIDNYEMKRKIKKMAENGLISKKALQKIFS